MYLGIDLGTSSIKVVLLDAQHNLLAVADAALTVSRPHPRWSEQDPQDWWQALQTAMAKLQTEYPVALASVRAIGLSGQMHGAVVLDSKRNVLRPAILWNDGRAVEQCTQLETRQPHSRAITGNLAMPGFTAPKLLWLEQHEPEVFAKMRTVLLPKDWLRLILTGEMVSEMSDASGTLWLDVAARTWSEAMLQASHMNMTHMPRLVEGNESSGHLLSTWAQAWGMRAHTVVAGGGGDNAASAVGIGAVSPGQGFVSLGTSGVIFVVTDSFRPAPDKAVHAFAHALPQRWHQMSVMLSAASALSWAVQLTGRADEACMLAEAEQLSPAQRSCAPIFLPYLSGERTPHNNPHATGLLAGLTSNHSPADIAYAVIEGVSFGLMDGLAAMQQDRTTTVLTLVGGGARSDLWAQLLASALDCSLHRDNAAHSSAAIGAARLAWLADGGSEAEVCRASGSSQIFEPDAIQGAMLSPRYERFKTLYAASAIS